MKGIVIGAGYSVLSNEKILKDMASISWRESILFFITDRMLYIVDQYGFDPLTVVTCCTEPTEGENYKIEKKFFQAPSTATAQKIKVYLSCQHTEQFRMDLEEMHYEIAGYYHRSPYQCITRIEESCPVFHDGGNVGVALIWVANHFFGIKDIATIGIDLQKSPLDNYPESLNWDGELQQSIISSLLLTEKGVKIYNCNPNGEGRFYTPIHRSTIDNFINEVPQGL